MVAEHCRGREEAPQRAPHAKHRGRRRRDEDDGGGNDGAHATRSSQLWERQPDAGKENNKKGKQVNCWNISLRSAGASDETKFGVPPAFRRIVPHKYHATLHAL